MLFHSIVTDWNSNKSHVTSRIRNQTAMNDLNCFTKQTKQVKNKRHKSQLPTTIIDNDNNSNPQTGKGPFFDLGSISHESWVKSVCGFTRRLLFLDKKLEDGLCTLPYGFWNHEWTHPHQSKSGIRNRAGPTLHQELMSFIPSKNCHNP